MIDSHTHLFLCDGSEADVVASASAAGVARMLTVGMDAETNPAAIAAAERHEGVFATVGRHPNEAAGFSDDTAAEILRLGAHEKVRAIGETGLDYYRDTAQPADQRRAFAAQIEIAVELDLPIVIHARDPEGGSDAIDEIFATLDARAAGHAVILHCFSAPQRVADAAERGWYCSFAGNVTYPKSEALRVAAAAVPEDLILVETDA
ncbi:MAG: TatD family deoxyribonuclease, partial [Solirubrobacterales bacterium]|nr:TatD family deoxyribonuclease [Solirubrobacterales bacterium]